MAFQLNSKQLPNEAILDVFNKQCYLGNQFSIQSGVISVSGTSEVPFLFMGNASSTTTTLFQCLRKLVVNDVSGATGAIFRIYKNPTGVTGGTILSPINLRYASAISSAALVVLQPNVSTSGSIGAAFSVGWENQNESEVLHIIDPGYSQLITVQPTASTSIIVDLVWYELPSGQVT